MKVDLTFERIATAIQDIVVPDVDVVVGIARGGIVPASLLGYRLGCGLVTMSVNYRDDDNRPRHDEPVIYGPASLPDDVQSVLLVDDVSVSGATLEIARGALPGCRVTTLVLKGRADIVVFPDISTCVNWPWNSKLSLNGQHPVTLETT
jgi:hypoxanthine phosphoribosyltransferase